MTWNEYPVEYNQDAIDIQNEMIDQFWDSVQNDIRPAWDGAESTYQAVRLENPEIEFREVDLSATGVFLLQAQERADRANSELLKAKSEVMAVMGKAKYGILITNSGAEKIVTRQMRGGAPSLVINKKGTSWI